MEEGAVLDSRFPAVNAAPPVDTAHRRAAAGSTAATQWPDGARIEGSAGVCMRSGEQTTMTSVTQPG